MFKVWTNIGWFTSNTHKDVNDFLSFVRSEGGVPKGPVTFNDELCF